jgi:hypothetical protein
MSVDMLTVCQSPHTRRQCELPLFTEPFPRHYRGATTPIEHRRATIAERTLPNGLGDWRR